MPTQAQQAGPGRDRRSAFPVGLEAAGPAGPRLTIEEVNVQLRADCLEVHVALAAGVHRFVGSATKTSDASTPWQLAAAATVAAMQRYLQHCVAVPPAPQVQLVDTATLTPAAGSEVVSAMLRLEHGSNQTHLLGSALVRNDRCSTAVAAALDAASRCLSLFPLPAAAPIPETLAPLTSGADERGPRLEDAAVETTAPPTPQLYVAPPRACSPTVTSANTYATLGIEISPTSVRAAAVDPEGQVIAEARRHSRAAEEPEPTLAAAMEAAEAVVADLDSSPHRVSALGLALPGRLRLADGVCVSSGDFPSWHDVDVAARFSGELDIPVSIIGTVDAAALAEALFGAAKGLRNAILVRVGLDIDVAVIRGNQLLLADETAPGRAGHMVVSPDGTRCTCGETGCWQALAGREALVARVVRDIGSGAPSAVAAAVENRLGSITPALICRMASAGDAVARNAIEETGRSLALGLGNLITLFDPEAIVLDTVPSSLGSALRHAAASALKASPRAQAFSRCVLLPPELNDAAPVLGAAAWAAQHPN